MAQSSTVRVMGPTVSIDQQAGRTPYLLTKPQVGLNPTSPLQAAGIRMEPPVSSPKEAAHRNAAVAAAEPLDEMPGFLVRSQGLWGVPPGW